ncbi:hypothetical protein CkaCkLH20_09645 [Colletotrichum karsti]|uniref:Uncharacterized protein n=1 Tax=Colletotrichum karsti TaxID=1095194 RepID=A0A9P6HZ34_9PEZI|nr:uncharacterized protein CkaCkLH20_09645 [Colletotrichum karsti]KAF9872782.1 hypothetical protein CkaCkLH20_09645 [Colletotrichum karsti]
MGFPPSTYTSVRPQAGVMSYMPWYNIFQQHTPAPAIPEIVLTTPEGENIHGDDIPRGRGICGYSRDYHHQQIQFFHNCEFDLLPLKPGQQRSMVRNAIAQREHDDLELQYERDMAWLEVNEVYRLCSKDDAEQHDKSAGQAGSAPADSQISTRSKRSYNLSSSWSDVPSDNKRRKTTAEKAGELEEKRERERQRADLNQKAQTARRAAAELKAEMNRFGVGRCEMDELRKQDEKVQKELKMYGEKILSLYDEDMSDDSDEEQEDDDWEGSIVFEMDEDVESDWDWEIL